MMLTGRAWFAWALPGSAALHLILVAELPNETRSAPPRTPSVIEVVVPNVEPAPPPRPTAEPAAPTPVAAPVPQQPATAPRGKQLASAPPSVVPSERATNEEAPMDFTSTVLSNEGPGIAIGGPGGAKRAAVPPVGPTTRPPGSDSTRAPIVPAGLLSRPPRAPGLDLALERNYPPEARRSGIAGRAVLRVTILPDGRVGEVARIEESWRGFGEACEKTVRNASWEPPIDREGHPVATEITYTCRFEVRG